jgi:hypothetical protein
VAGALEVLAGDVVGLVTMELVAFASAVLAAFAAVALDTVVKLAAVAVFGSVVVLPNAVALPSVVTSDRVVALVVMLTGAVPFVSVVARGGSSVVALGVTVASGNVVALGIVVALTSVVASGSAVALASVVTLTSVALGNVALGHVVSLTIVVALTSVVTFDSSVMTAVVVLVPATSVVLPSLISVVVFWKIVSGAGVGIVEVLAEVVAFPSVVAARNSVVFDAVAVASGVPVVFDNGVVVATGVLAFINVVASDADVPSGEAVTSAVPFAEGPDPAGLMLSLPVAATDKTVGPAVVVFDCVALFVGNNDDSDVAFPKAASAVVSTPVVGVEILPVALVVMFEGAPGTVGVVRLGAVLLVVLFVS